MIRAKALIAWGVHSADDQFDVFDRFIRTADPQWRVYALVSIQRKAAQQRDERFDAWAHTGETTLAKLVDQLRKKPIRWSHL